jgi:hypothetical protein
MKTKTVIISILLTPLSLFALYWFVRGLFTAETASLRGSGGKMLLVSASQQPYYFWPTLICWGFLGIVFLVPVVLGIRKHIFSNSSLDTDASRRST